MRLWGVSKNYTLCKKFSKIIDYYVKFLGVIYIFKECQNYLRFINTKRILTIIILLIRKKLEGLTKNFQNFCIFIHLNIGYIGFSFFK